jgi:peptide-methionine (R)-S-oxide reductase
MEKNNPSFAKATAWRSKTEEEWKAELTPEQYDVLRGKGTEAPFKGKYVNEHADGTYHCVACGNPLFSSSAKFDSKSGWPSFEDALPGAVEFKEDISHGMSRVEVVCANCSSHLGHVFPDGPGQTGQRYCMNSVCLDLKP